jgi:hypothetical protein
LATTPAIGRPLAIGLPGTTPWRRKPPHGVAGARQARLHLVGDEHAAGCPDDVHCLGDEATRVGKARCSTGPSAGVPKERDFRTMENGAVFLEEHARKNVLVAYQERKKDEIDHAFLQEKTSIGLLPHIQAQLLARTLRGDLDTYPALIWK